MRGRVNENGCAELSVTIPSYGPPGPMVPSENMAGGVFNPTARPFALDGAMFVDNGLPGRLAFALLSLLVVASALKALMKLFHDTCNGRKELVRERLAEKGWHWGRRWRSGWRLVPDHQSSSGKESGS